MIKEIALTILLIKNGFMSYTTQVNTVNTAIAVIEHDNNIHIHTSRVYKTLETYPETQGFDNRLSRMAKYETLMFKKHMWNNRAMNLIVDGPLFQKDIRYIAGYANVCKPFGGFAIVQIQSINSFGALRGMQSIIAVVHELSHNLGAEDLANGLGYMNIGASGLNPLPTKFDDVSLKEIQECLK